jgi:hypothetical protein
MERAMPTIETLVPQDYLPQGGTETDAEIPTYRALVAPHVHAVQAVLTGQRDRYKFRFEDAVLMLDHGCLMGRIFYQGRITALPSFARDVLRDTPYLRAWPPHQSQWLSDCLSLPKGLLLFYFSLLKEVFAGAPLSCRLEDPASGKLIAHPMPLALQPILQEVGWAFR